MGRWNLLVAGGMLFLLAACGSEDRKEGVEAGICLEGTSEACTCDDGAVGERLCGGTGVFGACACEGAGGTGGSDEGEGGSGGDGEEPGPCGLVPAEGICAGSGLVRRCVEDEQGEARFSEVRCASWETCVVDEDGASCVTETEKCEPGASICGEDGQIGTCVSGGTWSWEPCETTCTNSPIGAFCGSGIETTTVRGTLSYDARKPDSEFWDWTETFRAPAAGLLAVSLHDGSPIDAAFVGDDGTFEIQVPTAPAGGDVVTFFAYRPTAAGARISYAVGYPGPRTGERRAGDVVPADAEYWNWSLPLPIEDGGEWVIGEDEGSGALRLFDWLHRTWDVNTGFHGKDGRSIVMWWAAGTSWDCGACFDEQRITIAGNRFSTQIWISGDPDDQTHWSDAVTVHELGHWAMSAFGVSPDEGGVHCLGVPTMPGLAWSEGWATFHSADLRDSSLYYDKQAGTFFWMDLQTAEYAGGFAIEAPTAGLGLMQRVDENWVAATLWHISRDPSVGSEHMHRTLSSARMMTRPFGRGYTTKWFNVDRRCRPTNVFDTGRSAPMYADYLDALICSDVSPDVVMRLIDPYPYPANEPICL